MNLDIIEIYKKPFIIFTNIGKVIAIILTAWQLIQLGISLEKLHVKLDTILQCVDERHGK